jgi:cell division initiation protein
MFTKSLGGYKTSEVDDFIDVCAETVEKLTAENTDLKSKIELLANKVVEYRNEEDSIRTALLSAQRMGDSILKEANHKAGLILEDAQIKAEKIEETAQKQIKDQIDELERLKKLVSEFKAQMLGVYREHLAMIDVLPEYKAPEQEPVEEVVTEQPVEQSVEEAIVEELPAQELEVVQETVEEEVIEEEKVAAEEPEMPETPDTSIVFEEGEEEERASLFPFDDESAIGNSRYANLKFGADYSIGDDDDDEEDEKPRRRRKK